MNDSEITGIKNEFEGNASWWRRVKDKSRAMKKIFKAKHYFVITYDLDKKNNTNCDVEAFNSFQGAGNILLHCGSEINKYDNHALSVQNIVQPNPPCGIGKCNGMMHPCELAGCLFKEFQDKLK